MSSPNPEVIRQRIQAIVSKRELLVKLAERPDLTDLKLDITQALQEMDDLIAEFQEIFP
ncbi:MAG: hypothetical protein ACK4QL_00970 [Pseudanabaenaceae cyanobacterium]